MLLALSILLALLGACGDESSSSVSPEPRQCEEQSDDCDDTSSSSGEVSKNSSSSQKSADKGKSSSSVEKSKSSSSEGKVASSSSKKDETSSSSVEKAKESSSSVKPSSSSEAKSSSSEDVKQSSSSVVASSSSVVGESSSSEYVPYNHRKALYSDSVLTGAYKQFTDTRNGRTYYYLTINGVDKNNKPASVTVMAENLNIGVMVDGKKEQDDDSKIERYCYDNDTTNCDKYGGLYQWAEMMQLPSRCNTESCADSIKPNHQGICPDGWRLLTYDDFYIVVHADGNDAGAKGVRATSFGGLNYSGYSLIGAGYNWNHEFEDLKTGAYWYYPIESVEYGGIASIAGYQSNGETANSSGNVYKTHGFSVRCVMVE
ncbi:hypothetical protein B7988_00370 [Fibrobacter sp. UWB1]|nr:hypothetical protein B7988_00370 [Fibrobacter sp. UWB1]